MKMQPRAWPPFGTRDDERCKLAAPAAENQPARESDAAGPPLALDWRLRATDAGPLIIDLIVEVGSLLVAQRSGFAAVIERQKLDGLLGELRARTGSTNSQAHGAACPMQPGPRD